MTAKIGVSIVGLVLLVLFITACLQWPWLIFAVVGLWIVLWALKNFLFIVASLIRMFMDWVAR